jgi:uncharacterized membrane protein
MATLLARTAVGMLAFMLLDGLWLGLLMRAFYRDQLAPIARLANGGFAPNWPAALVVYLALGAGLALFVAPRASGLASAAGWGALFGLVVYAVYDFTNYSTLRQWPFALTLIDVAWGTTASAIGAAAVWMALR